MAHKLGQLVLIFLLSTTTTHLASAAGPSAYDVIEQKTVVVMEVVKAANSYVDKDPERYFQLLQSALDDLVDYDGFARAVMGPYASKQRYQSLSTEGKAELRAQVDRFTQVMRLGLVRTYGKGLLALGGSRTEVLRPQGEVTDDATVSITQLIYSSAPQPYEIQYQMRLDSSGQWKLRNLIVESISLGGIYRNQFLASAKDHEGNLNAVIDAWTAPVETREITQEASL